MSWSSSSKDAVDKGTVAAAIEMPQLSDAVGEEQAAQFHAAVAAAESLLSVVGRDGDKVMVTVSGHANPGHGPRPGWADECITVSVRQIPAPAEGA